MLPDRVSNPGPLTYESGVLPIALRGPVWTCSACHSGRTVIYILADCVLEFPGGNEIAHLLGVFMNQFFLFFYFFFALSVSDLTLPKREKVVLILWGFEISSSIREEGLRRRDTQTAMWVIIMLLHICWITDEKRVFMRAYLC